MAPSIPSVVIVGAGFAGLAAARALSEAPVEVTVIDRRNHHLFQPLLYQVATAALSPADIAWPVRGLLSRQRNARVVMARVTGIDPAGRRVLAEDGASIRYDHLMLATGARHAYFGRDDWAAAAPGLKKIDDATNIRRRILLAFEQAEQEDEAEARRALMSFVVVGAGPTRVEMAGVMASPAGRWLGAETDRAGRIRVAPDLSVPGLAGVYAVGDTVSIDSAGRPVPGVAPAAKQMGRHAGRLIARRIAGRGDGAEPFRYRDAGAMATIGRGAAVAEIGHVRLSGPLAWLVWAVAHVYFLIGARNRMVVAITWAWSYLTFDRGARLITGPAPAASGRAEAEPSRAA